MPSFSDINGLPLPIGTDDADMQSDMAALGAVLDTRMNPRFATTSARDAAITSPIKGEECWIDAYLCKMVRFNSYWGFATGTPLALLYSSVDQNVATGGNGSPLSLEAEVFDLIGAHDTVTNNTRYTPTVPGNYMFQGGCSWDTAITAGVRTCRFVMNGVTNLLGPEGYSPTSADVTISVSTHTAQFATLNGTTDYVELFGLQDSGSTVATDASFGPSRRTAMLVTYMGGV